MTATELAKNTSINAEVSEFLTRVAMSKPQEGTALQVYEWALQLDPDNAEAHNALGRMALKVKLNQEALDHFLCACEADQGNPVYRVNASIAFRNLGRVQEATTTISLKSLVDFVPAMIQTASIYEEQDKFQDAFAVIDRAVRQNPDSDECFFYRGILRAKLGDWVGAFADMEHRPSHFQLRAALDEWPEWTGQDLTGKTILVCREQGLGDEIMFARFIAGLKQRGAAKVIYYAYSTMARIMTRLSSIDVVISEGWELAGKFDYWIGSASVPHLLGPNGGDTEYLWKIGRDCLDLSAVDSLIQHHEKQRFIKLTPVDGTLRVGLCWAGNPDHKNDRNRSMQFADMQPLLDTPGCTFYGFQYGPEGQKANGLIPDVTAHCHDMFDTARAISNLDLVITVDTGMAHLAGMLGKPVWMLQGKIPDWRWTKQWYPSMKIYSHERGWSELIDQVSAELVTLAGTSKPVPEPLWRDYVMSDRDHGEILTSQCRYGEMSWLANDTYIGRALELYGEYSDSEAELLRSVLKPGDIVIEAGANIGGLTVPIAEAVKPGRVLAFEPQPEYFRLLRKNASHGVDVFPLALGKETAGIHIQAIEKVKVHAPGWKGADEMVEVEQITIDNLMEEYPGVALIKIDVDGQENDILIGAERTIARHRPLLYVERDKDHLYPNLIPWIDARGYRIYQHDAPLYNPSNFRGYQPNVFGNLISRMLFCVPAERYDLRQVTEKLQRVKFTTTRGQKKCLLPSKS